MTTARDKFEAWAITQHLAIHRNGGEQYVNTATQHVWDGWKACWPQAIEAAAVECETNARYWREHHEVADTVLDAGKSLGAAMCADDIRQFVKSEGEPS